MSARKIGVIYRKEVTDLLRDRRTIMSMIVVPLLMFPMLAVGLGYLANAAMGTAKREIPVVMIVGGADSPKLLATLRADDEFHFEQAQSDYAAEISNKRIRAAISIPAGFDAAEESEIPQKIYIDYFEGDVNSSLAADKLEKYFDKLRDRTVRERLEARQIPPSIVEPFTVEQKNVAPPEKVAGATLGGMIPYLVILLCFTGAMYPAMDMTAGEKERGTMETLLSSPVSRTDIVLGKYLTVLSASLTTAILAVISMGVSFSFGKQFFETEGHAATTNMHIGLKAVLAVLLMGLPLSMLFSAVLIAVSLFAKSFREAQTYLTPLTFVIIIPAVAALLPGVELNARTALIPILSTSLVSKELVSGIYHWGYITMIFGASCVYAAAAIAAAVVLFNREEVLFRV